MLVLASVLVVGSPLVAWHFARAREAEASARPLAQRNLYAADMGLALQAFSLGNRTRARELIGRHLPGQVLPPGSADHRGWEWHFLNAQLVDAASVTLGQAFRGIPAVALSDDGRHAAAACVDQRLRIWDWQSRTLLTNLPTARDARAVTFSSDGRTVYTVSWDSKIRVWDTPTGRLRYVVGGEVAAYYSAVLTPDETRLLTGNARGGVRIWDVTVDPPTEMGSWSANPGRLEITTLSFSPAGDRLYTRAGDGLRVWNTGLTRKARFPA